MRIVNKTLLICVTCFWALTISLPAKAQQTNEQYIRAVNYLLYLPDGYQQQDTLKKWPLLIFLHGSGERGDDLEKVKKHGPPKLVAQGKKFPFIVVSPQTSQQEQRWSTADLYALLQSCKQKYRVDADRIYLTGLSMGGFGTWSLAIEHPEEFAAIVPICGGGDTAEIWKLRHTAVWCFHGAKDNNVPLAFSQKMISALKVYNPAAKLTVYPDAEHDSWTATYNNDSLYQWLLSQKKFEYTQSTTVNTRLLEKYSGTYVGLENDTVVVQVKENGLQATHRNKTFPLLAASETVFFIDKHLPVEIQFVTGKAGKATGFIVYENNKTPFRKIR
ncbi:prolyl oligopeptidase family serine peptidase [Niastella vici]|uniref:prolyl oligopeptidase family serine peptidase n=1 Tax=Niastella vici TaxID=1703345 RepID=UPI0009C0FA74|nr:prolyl oligopeptidase family serine peptidase [Niastella vici]